MPRQPYKYKTFVIDWDNTDGFSPMWTTYNSWKAMRARCKSDLPHFYPYYKKKNINVCEEWQDSFENFVDDMGMCPKEGWSVDRIDGTKGYHVNNCEWASPLLQALNRDYGEDQGLKRQKSGNWTARVKIYGKEISLGTFEDKNLAKAYRDSGIRLLKKLCRLGFLE